MSGETEAVDPLEGSKPNLQDLSAHMTEAHEAQQARLTMEGAVADAIAFAAERPLAPTPTERAKAELVDSANGVVGDLKADLVSAQTAPEQAPQSSEAVQDALEDRVRSLYADLTSYQVAWRIAQKIPQDLTQILRGT